MYIIIKGAGKMANEKEDLEVIKKTILKKLNTKLLVNAKEQKNKFDLFFKIPKHLPEDSKNNVIDQIKDLVYLLGYKFVLKDIILNKQFDENITKFNNIYLSSVNGKPFIAEDIFNDSLVSKNNFYKIEITVNYTFLPELHLENDKTDCEKVIKDLELVTRKKFKSIAEEQLDLNLFNHYKVVLKKAYLDKEEVYISLPEDRLKCYYDNFFQNIKQLLNEENFNYIISYARDKESAFIKFDNTQNVEQLSFDFPELEDELDIPIDSSLKIENTKK